MKTAILIISSSLLLAASVLAAPRLAVDATVTEFIYNENSNSPKGEKVLARFHALTESGKPVTVRAAGNEWTITPTLLPNGRVSFSQSMMLHYKTPRARKIDESKPRIVKVGEPHGMVIGTVAFMARTSVVK